ncbi:MAG TPA: PKD domain-containing protein, partial [Saprospiraceae bacterium]|nr:PKD domain-containing protein [Saprospiraceae bacterium]
VVTDANGCSTAQVFTLEENTVVANVSNIVDENCGAMDGGFTVNGSGGTPPYSYDMGNGATNNNTFTNLNAGTYEVTVTDAAGCADTVTATVGELLVTVVLGDVIDATCGLSNGAISVIGEGGTLPYTFDFGGGPTSSNVVFGLSGGNYDVSITDANGCSDEITIEVLNIDLNPVSNFSYNANLLAVDFTNISNGGISYLWDFGDGDTSSLFNPTHIYDAEGTYEVCLTVTNNCGNHVSCEMITVSQPEPVEVLFDLSEESGEEGDTVYVSVSVENFENIISFQKSIHIIDTMVAKMISVADFNLLDLDNSDFSISSGTTTIDWTTNSPSGVSVNNGTVIYKIGIVLLLKSECTNIVIDGSPLPLEVVQNINGMNTNIGTMAQSGEVCVTGGLGGGPVSIAGLIFKENNQMVANVEVTCTSVVPKDTTATDGAYEFLNLPEGANYVVTPYKNDNPVNGVTGLDLVRIQHHILGTILLDSPYKMIAADANRSGTITALDLVAMQHLILGNMNSFPNGNPSWRFVPEAYVFPDTLNPFFPAFPEAITLNNLTADALTENFIAIKIGDVNLTSIPALTNEPSENLVFLIDNQGVTDDGELIIDFKVKNFKNIEGWQMDLEFDAEQMIFEEMQEGALPDFNIQNIGYQFLEKGILPMVWVNRTGKEGGYDLADETAVFRLKFRVNRDFVWNKNAIKIKKHRLEQRAFKDDKSVNVKLLFLDKIKEENEKQKMWVSPNYPNPFGEMTTIQVYLPQSDIVDFEIYNQSGKLVFQSQKKMEKGRNEIRVDETILSNLGLYHYQIRTSQNHFFGKMIFMR